MLLLFNPRAEQVTFCLGEFKVTVKGSLALFRVKCVKQSSIKPEFWIHRLIYDIFMSEIWRNLTSRAFVLGVVEISILSIALMCNDLVEELWNYKRAL